MIYIIAINPIFIVENGLGAHDTLTKMVKSMMTIN